MTEEEKALSERLFSPGAQDLVQMKKRAHRINMEYNATPEEEAGKRSDLLAQLLGETGENCRIQGPMYFHYGRHTRVGRNFFANFNLTVQDDGPVTIGDDVNLGPGVTIVTPLHPMLGEERRNLRLPDGTTIHACLARPVVIGNDCWLGANVTVCPGVRIGDGCVIGAGSVVTKDIPAGTFAAGNPCRVIRTLTDEDSMYRHPEVFDTPPLPSGQEPRRTEGL